MPIWEITFCESCGFHRPPLTVAVNELTELTNTSSHFKINGTNYHINIGGLYNIYNALAAVAVAHYFDVSPDVIKRGFDKSKAVFGRQETTAFTNVIPQIRIGIHW